MITIIGRCGACTLVYLPVQVGPTFRVRVEDRGHPVGGLRVKIGSDRADGNRTVTDTDENGFARFSAVPPGSYHLSVDQDDAGIPDGAALDVKLDGPTDVTVPLKWPSTAPVLVRSLNGTMHRPDYLPGQSQPRLSLDLLEGISGRKLESLQTSDTGEFSFENGAPGLYFLRLKPSGLKGWSGEEITGLVAVAVDPGAPTDHLDVDLGWTSCGLWYADRSQCPQSNLRIEQLSGQVLDTSGAAISEATILLFDPAETLVERLRSDREGKFTSPHQFTGTYQLVVSRPGFTSLRRTLRAGPTGLSALTVKLAVFGGCSSADLN